MCDFRQGRNTFSDPRTLAEQLRLYCRIAPGPRGAVGSFRTDPRRAAEILVEAANCRCADRIRELERLCAFYRDLAVSVLGEEEVRRREKAVSERSSTSPTRS